MSMDAPAEFINYERLTIATRTDAASQSTTYIGQLEKKGALGVWSKKDVEFNPDTLDFKVTDSGKPVFYSILRGIALATGDEAGTGALAFTGEKDQITLRGTTQRMGGEWYMLCSEALEAKGQGRFRQYDLPPVDPRFNLPIVAQIPLDHLVRFVKLEASVLYFFAPVKKLGSGSISKKVALHDRIVFVSDRCLYVTKGDSSVTHCAKIDAITQVFTNVNTTVNGPFFVVLKLPEQDLHIQTTHARYLLHVINTIFGYLHNGLKTLTVRPVDDPQDGAVKLNLQSDVSITMILPTLKSQLKKALDQFAKQHGIKFESVGLDASPELLSPPTGPSRIPSFADRMRLLSQRSASNLSGSFRVTSDSGSEPSTPASPSGLARRLSAGPASPMAKRKDSVAVADSLPKNDPLAWFLIDCELPHLYHQLRAHAVDLDILEMMDSDDLTGFGVVDPTVVASIREHVLLPGFIEDAKLHAASCAAGQEWNKPKRDLPSAQASPAVAADGDTPEPPMSGLALPAPDSIVAQESMGSTNVVTPHSNIVADLSDSDGDLPIRKSTGSLGGSPPSQVKAPIVLESDDEDDLVQRPQVSSKPKIVLDDDDI